MKTGTLADASAARRSPISRLLLAATGGWRAAVCGGMLARHVVLAAILGVAAGFVTGPNLVLLTLILAFLLLNAHVRTFAVCWAVAAAVAAYLHDAAAHIGGVLVDQTPVGALLDRHADSPLVGLLGLHNPALCGGLALAALFSAGTARTLGTLVKELLRDVGGDSLTCTLKPGHGSQQPDGSSGTPPVDNVAWYSKLSAPRKALAGFFWGSLDDAPARISRHTGWLRPFGWAFALLLACIPPYLPGWLGARELKTMWLPRVAESLGMRYVAGQLEYSGWTGRLVVRDLVLATSAGREAAVRVASLEARLSPGRLLRSQLHAEQVAVRDILLSQPEGGPGQAGLDVSDATRPTAKRGVTSSPLRHDLAPLLAFSSEVRSGIMRLKALLETLHALRGCEVLCDSKGEGKTTRVPRLLVKQLKLESLPREWQLGRHAVIALGPIASSPPLVGSATRLRLTSPRHGLRLSAILNLHEERGVHRVRFTVDEQPLLRLLALQPSAGVAIRRGEAALRGAGQVDHRGVDLAVTAALRGLDLEFAPQVKLAGLDSQLCAELLEASGRLSLSVHLRGPWHAPRWELRSPHLARQLAEQASASGREDLRRRVQLALAPATRARRKLAKGHVATPVAVDPSEPPGEPYAIATDEAVSPDSQPQAAAVQAHTSLRPYPRTSTPEDEEPAGQGVMQPAAKQGESLASFVQNPRATQQRSVRASPSAGQGVPRAGQAAAMNEHRHGNDGDPAARPRLPPELPLPGPIGLKLGRDPEAPSAIVRAGGVEGRFPATPQRASPASYSTPSGPTARAAPVSAEPPEYMQPPQQPELTSEAASRPKSKFSRWARGIVNKVFGGLADGSEAAEESTTARPRQAAELEPHPAEADGVEACPYEEAAADRQVPWYRRLWR